MKREMIIRAALFLMFIIEAIVLNVIILKACEGDVLILIITLPFTFMFLGGAYVGLFIGGNPYQETLF